jgi:fucose 4-O-acetylase-like acetyltransferase
MIKTGEREAWIDMLRGVCMLAILLDHTEIYYTDGNIVPYSLYVLNALIIFFAISGYLMFKHEGFALRKKVKSIVRTLIIPYFIYATIIALPKAVVHGNSIDLISMAQDIVMGNASWFVTALVIAELIFGLVLWWSHGSIRIIMITSVGCFFTSTFTVPGNPDFPWNIPNALQAQLFLCGGYITARYKHLFSQYFDKRRLAALSIVFIVIKIVEQHWDAQLLVFPIIISSYPLFLADAMLSILLAFGLARLITVRIQWLEWIGRRSLVFYFFCGGVPLLIAYGLNSIGFSYSNDYIRVVIAFGMVCLGTSVVAWFVYRFLPWTVGKRSEPTNAAHP